MSRLDEDHYRCMGVVLNLGPFSLPRQEYAGPGARDILRKALVGRSLCLNQDVVQCGLSQDEHGLCRKHCVSWHPSRGRGKIVSCSVSGIRDLFLETEVPPGSRTELVQRMHDEARNSSKLVPAPS